MTSAADLFALQEIDLSRDAHRALIADIDYRLTENEALNAARGALEDAEDDLTLVTRQQRDLDARLADLDAKIKPIETRLYDGSVRNPRELEDLQKDINSLKRQRNALDDEGLTNIEALESATSAVAAARTALAEVEAIFKEREASLRSERSRAARESETLDSERSSRTQGMDPTALGMYEKLRSVKQGRAVARLERTSCSGCHISLPIHLVQRVKGGDTIVQCPNCERILAA
jgi:predicted  nucleic acid-binding Zn-ribbon protein